MVYKKNFGIGEEACTRAHTVDCQPCVSSVISMQKPPPLLSPVSRGLFCLLSAVLYSFFRGDPSISMSSMHTGLMLHSVLYRGALITGIWMGEDLAWGFLMLSPRQSENIYTPSCWHVLERPAPAVVLASEKLFFILFN